MAAKKAGEADGAKGLDPDEGVILSIKCRREWREWVTALARAERATVATLVDQMLTRRAKGRGLPDPPSRGQWRS